MGIPAFFRKIIEKYPNTHFWRDDLQVQNFFIDFNSMVYQIIRKLDPTLNVFDFEKKLISETVKRLKYVCNDLIKPTEFLMIAMDGPPPRAKMVQQRARRYKTVIENNFKKELERKYKITVPQNSWSTASISPGTLFMKLLADKIRLAINSKEFHCKNILFSDTNEAGEGEHKLMPYIKSSNGTTVIYSPDADMIILSIMTNKDSIYILRDTGETEIEIRDYIDNDFLYLSINEARRAFFFELTKDYKDLDDKRLKEVVNSFLDDYTFLTFLCGNDFVKTVPSVRIKDGGLDLLLSVYRKHYKRNHLIINGKINKTFFVSIIDDLAVHEKESGQKWQRKRDRLRKGTNSRKVNKELKEWENELLRFQHEEYYSASNPQFEKYNRVFNELNYFSDSWKELYNKAFFENDIKDVCAEYYKSLIFCWKYYHKEVPSWTYYYPYRASPTMSDLSDWYKTEKTNPTFEEGFPISPLEQLLFILPKNSFNLIPASIRNVDDKYFPMTFEMDVLAGEKFIYSDPILPEVPLEYVRNIVRGATLTPGEMERNRVT